MSNNQFNKPQIVTETHKSCSCCEKLKLFSEFHGDRKNVIGNYRAYYCKECANQKTRKYNSDNANNPAYRLKKKQAYVKNRYNLTLDEYLSKLREQDSKCGICKIELPSSGFFTHLDHDHSSGKIRGFLCTNCNRGLGHFQDNQEFLMAAVDYLKAHTDDGNQKEGAGL